MKHSIIYLLCVIISLNISTAQGIKQAYTYKIMDCGNNKSSSVSLIDTDGLNGYDYAVLRYCDGALREYTLDFTKTENVDPIPAAGRTTFSFYSRSNNPKYLFDWDKKTNSPTNGRKYEMEEYRVMDMSVSFTDEKCRVAAVVYFPANGSIAQVSKPLQQSTVCDIINLEEENIKIQVVDPMNHPEILFTIQSANKGKAWVKINDMNGNDIYDGAIEISENTETIRIKRDKMPKGEYRFSFNLNDIKVSEKFTLH